MDPKTNKQTNQNDDIGDFQFFYEDLEIEAGPDQANKPNPAPGLIRRPIPDKQNRRQARLKNQARDKS